MQILNIRPAPPGDGGRTLARFDVALNDDCRLYDLKLSLRNDGSLGVYSPNAGGARFATFSAGLAREIAEAAAQKLGGATAHDQNAV